MFFLLLNSLLSLSCSLTGLLLLYNNEIETIYRVFINAKYCVFYAKKYIGTQKMKCNASLGRTRLTEHYGVK